MVTVQLYLLSSGTQFFSINRNIFNFKETFYKCDNVIKDTKYILIYPDPIKIKGFYPKRLGPLHKKLLWSEYIMSFSGLFF